MLVAVLLLSWQSLPFAAPGTTLATAQATPIRTVATRQVLGPGKAVQLWKISVCTNSALVLPTERLLMGTTIPFIPNTLAEDIVGRQVSSDLVTIIGKNGNTALTLATTIATGVGIVAKSPNTLYASAAASVLQLVINAATTQAPNAQPYFSQLLPETLNFSAQGCTWGYLFSTVVGGGVQKWEVR
jgi:hypothetical protein